MMNKNTYSITSKKNKINKLDSIQNSILWLIGIIVFGTGAANLVLCHIAEYKNSDILWEIVFFLSGIMIAAFAVLLSSFIILEYYIQNLKKGE